MQPLKVLQLRAEAAAHTVISSEAAAANTLIPSEGIKILAAASGKKEGGVLQLRAGEGVSQRENRPHASGGPLLNQRTRMPAKRRLRY